MFVVFRRTHGKERNRSRLLRLLPLALLALLVLPLNAWAQPAYEEPGAGSSVQQQLRGLRVDLGLSTDSNVTRSNLPAERLPDQVISIHLGRDKVVPLGSNSQMVLSGFAGLEQLLRFHGLGKTYIGAEAEFQYRRSEEFDAPTFGINASATAEEYRSGLRDGLRLSFGGNLRMAVTDRIHLFAAAARNFRSASSAVFSTSDSSLRFNLDYALAPTQTLYLGGEYRRGDILSAGLPSLANRDLAKVLAPDDAFAQVGYTSYRFAGRTVLFTAGLNLALGAKESLDLSWRRVRSDPRRLPSVAVGGPAYYLTNQISLMYLKSF